MFLPLIMRENNLLSSANRLRAERIPSGRSFINIRNRIGPRIDPSSTGLVICSDLAFVESSSIAYL